MRRRALPFRGFVGAALAACLALVALAQNEPAEEATVGHWLFAPENVEGQTVTDLAGGNDGNASGEARLETYREATALVFDGQSQSVLLAEDHNTAGLPERELTAEAWVRLETGLVWGGILGAVQDNAADEKGWILGFNERFFTFAVSAEGGPPTLNYMASSVPFEPGQWYHVVGTYDGATTSIYVDGQLSASHGDESGDILYPPKTFFEIGAYHDSDEDYHMSGAIHEVRLLDRALSADEVRARYLDKRNLFPAPPTLKLPNIFANRMVLQREQAIPVWGWSVPGDEVTVTFNGQEVVATADEEGYWRADLAATEAGGPHELSVASHASGENHTYSDVLVGEVWVCSGQSNMQWAVNASANAAAEIAAADYPNIRLFTVPNVRTPEPQTNCGGRWDLCSPSSVPGFSAVGYFFGRKLNEELDVPIGLINASWGGSPCEAWVSREALEGDPDFGPILERAKGDTWNGTGMYNGMIHPILPYAMRGAIWYQGESNAGRAYQYRKLFPTMIRDWRQRWGQGDFPFYFVQLSPFNNQHIAWAELWGAQLRTLSLPNTGMAVITDVGDLGNIHPPNKQDVGLRLALWALAKDYGYDDLVYSGPLYKSMEVEGDRIRIHFEHTGSGLVSRDGQDLNWFQIAGEDEQFHAATATIDGDTVVVHSDEVAEPVAVRFGWLSNAQPNLMNKEALPASPFRTDDWTAVTAGQN